MSVTPANRLSLPLENCALLLKDCAAFQTLMGAASAAAAYARVFWYETDDEHVVAERTFPRTIINYAPGMNSVTRTSTTGFSGIGPIEVRIEITTAQDNIQDGHKDLLNKVGAVMEQIEALVTGGGQYLNVTKIWVMDIGRMDEAANNGLANYGAVLVLEWLGMGT